MFFMVNSAEHEIFNAQTGQSLRGRGKRFSPSTQALFPVCILKFV